MMSRHVLSSVLVLAGSVGGVAFGQSVDATSPLALFSPESPIFLDSIIEPDTLQDISEIVGTAEYEFANIVARVEDLTGTGFCTGFRLTADLFMTNYHCWQFRECQVQFHMGYETGKPEDEHRVFRCKEVLATYEQLDFALYRVEPADPVRDDIYPTGILSRQPLELNMPLIVPGHPAARTKQIDLSEQCHLTRVEPYDWYGRLNIQHKCDTLGGSSGSPVLDRVTGNIVGIHWGAEGGTGSNHAIPMSLILDYLEENLPEVYAELNIQ